MDSDTREGPRTSPWQLQRLSCRSNLIEEGFISAHSLGHSPPWQGGAAPGLCRGGGNSLTSGGSGSRDG